MTAEHPLVHVSLQASCVLLIHPRCSPNTTACRGSVCALAGDVHVSAVQCMYCIIRCRHFRNLHRPYVCRHPMETSFNASNLDRNIHSFVGSLEHRPSSPPPSWLPWSLEHVFSSPVGPEGLSNKRANPRNNWFNSLYHARRASSITDPMVRDKVLSCSKGRQINLSPDWWVGMHFPGLVWAQPYEAE